MDGALLQLVQEGTIDPRVAYDRALAQGGAGALPAGRGRGGVVSTPVPAGPPAERPRHSPPRPPARQPDRPLPRDPAQALGLGPAPVGRIAPDHPDRRRARAHALPRLSEGDFYNLVGPITPPTTWETFQETGDVDFAYQMGQAGALPRQPLAAGARLGRGLPAHPLAGPDRRGPQPARRRSPALYAVQRGLILVTGPTGSGKSTTLAAVLDRMNKRLAHHVVTIEDPIEFVHTNDKSVFTQREIGPDVPSFAEGVKAAIREDPDCLLVGEMRDLETMRMALTAAETGLLVFATVHTNSAAKAVDRIIDAFPARGAGAGAHRPGGGAARASWPSSSCARRAAAACRPSRSCSGRPRCPTRSARARPPCINNQIATGKAKGMISMDQSLTELVKGGRRRAATRRWTARSTRSRSSRRSRRETQPTKPRAPPGPVTPRRQPQRKHRSPARPVVTSTVPPWSSAMRATIARPNPDPSGLDE